MTRIAFSADIHIGNHRQHGGKTRASINERCQICLDTFEASLSIAEELGCTDYMVVGDLLDNDNTPPQIIAQVQEVIDRYDLRVHLLLGNHEMTTEAENDHSLSPLRGNANVIDQPTVLNIGKNTDVCLLAAPFKTGQGDDWLKEDVERLAKEATRSRLILATHLGISDDQTPPFLIGAHDSINVDVLSSICKENGVNTVVTGNWHDHKKWSAGTKSSPVYVHQIGSLCPTGWDNPGFEGYGYIAVYDTDTDEVTYKSVPGPRFIKTLAIDGPPSKEWKRTEKALRKSHKEGNINFLRIKTSPSHFKEMSGTFEALVEEGILRDGKLLVEDSEAKVAAVNAATAVKSAVNLEHSVASYISNMQLEEGVSREAVAARVQKYMRAS